MNEHRVHQIFQVSVLLKGAHAVVECVGGVVLALISRNTIVNLVNALTQDELVEDKNDLIATYLVIAHLGPARGSTIGLADSTNRTVSRTEALLAVAVLTTERKAA